MHEVLDRWGSVYRAVYGSGGGCVRLYPVVEIGEVAHGTVIDIDWVCPEPLMLLGFVLHGARPWSPDEKTARMVMADLTSPFAPTPDGLEGKARGIASQIGERAWKAYNDCTVLTFMVGVRRVDCSGALPLSVLDPGGALLRCNVGGGVPVWLKIRNDGPPMQLRGSWACQGARR
jgi:hypothetical protein